MLPSFLLADVASVLLAAGSLLGFVLLALYFFCLLSVLCLSLGLRLGQPVTLIFVFCLITAPFCAVSSVGIVSVPLQRFALFAVSAEYGALGKVQFEGLRTARPGPALKMDVRTPFLEIAVSPCRSIVTPSPWSTTISSGYFAAPWETKNAGPLNGVGSTGVLVVASPILAAAGQLAGFSANVFSGQAFCSVLRRAGSFAGRLTLTFAMFASLPCGVAG